MSGYVTIRGRNICKRWLAEHPNAYTRVSRIAVASAPNKPRRVRIDRTIYARFHMPAIRCIPGDTAQTRVVNLNSIYDREWAEEMATNYAAISPSALTTFFPEHP